MPAILTSPLLIADFPKGLSPTRLRRQSAAACLCLLAVPCLRLGALMEFSLDLRVGLSTELTHLVEYFAR